MSFLFLFVHLKKGTIFSPYNALHSQSLMLRRMTQVHNNINHSETLPPWYIFPYESESVMDTSLQHQRLINISLTLIHHIPEIIPTQISQQRRTAIEPFLPISAKRFVPQQCIVIEIEGLRRSVVGQPNDPCLSFNLPHLLCPQVTGTQTNLGCKKGREVLFRPVLIRPNLPNSWLLLIGEISPITK